MTDHKTTNTSRHPLVRKMLLYSAVLMSICLASAAGVSILYVTNRDRIRQNQLKSFHQTLSEVLGDAKDVRPLDENARIGEADVYVASTDNGVRYAAKASARGYQSIITVLVSLDAKSAHTPLPDDPVIHRAAVVSSQETPGLGENINKVKKDLSLWAALSGIFVDQPDSDGPNRPWFQDQFNGKKLSDLEVTQSGKNGIRPITGATISSRGTTKAVRKAIETAVHTTETVNDETHSTSQTEAGTRSHTKGENTQ